MTDIHILQAELADRAKRRVQRAKAEERRVKKEETRLRKEEERRNAPVIQDMASMPLPSATLHSRDDVDVQAAILESLQLQHEQDTAADDQGGGVSFAHIAKWGFASGLNAPPPSSAFVPLGSSTAAGSNKQQASPLGGPQMNLGVSPPPLQGVWAKKGESALLLRVSSHSMLPPSLIRL